MAYSSMMSKEYSSSLRRRAKKGGISHHEKYSRKSSVRSRGAGKTRKQGCRAIFGAY